MDVPNRPKRTRRPNQWKERDKEGGATSTKVSGRTGAGVETEAGISAHQTKVNVPESSPNGPPPIQPTPETPQPTSPERGSAAATLLSISATDTNPSPAVAAGTGLEEAEPPSIGAASSRASAAPTESPNREESPIRRHLRSVVGGIGAAARSLGRAAGINVSTPIQVAGASGFSGSPADSALTEEVTEVVETNETSEQLQALFQAELAELGDGGLSDEEGDEVDVHNNAVVNDPEEWDKRNQANSFCEDKGIPGQPDGWFPPGPPEDWAGYCPRYDAPPTFSQVDNPGGWSDFTFQAK